MKLLFSLERATLLPVLGTDAFFPVNNIYCVGRNYSSHAMEMGVNHEDKPFFFTKPNWTIAKGELKYPKKTKDLQYEVELVLAIGKNHSIAGIAVGIDFTKRDIQSIAKKKGKPWFEGKSFLGSSSVSHIAMMDGNINLSKLRLKLEVNGKIKQVASCRDMLLKPSEIIYKLAENVPLKRGDLIFTGTPSGVGKVTVGDRIFASIDKIVELSVVVG